MPDRFIEPGSGRAGPDSLNVGIEDRDYYRERYRNVVAHPKRGSSTLTIVFVWLAVVAGLFFGFRTFMKPSPPAPSVVRSAPAPTAASTPTTESARQSQRAVEATEAPQLTAQSSSASTIYRCGSSYGNAPCANGRTVEGPAASGFDSRPSDKLALLVEQGRTAQDAGPGTTTTTTTTTIVGNACPYLAQLLNSIDQAARQPQSLQKQDRLRAERQRVRDQQARAHC